jgi:hypothetical protein
MEGAMKIEKKMMLFILAGLLLAVGATSYATTSTGGSEPMIPPEVKLENVEVAHYWGYWFFSKKTEPTKGKLTDNVGAPLDLAFIFNITNPNSYPVRLEGLKFTIAFEEFELNTVNAYEQMSIPANETNQYRVHAMFDVATSFLSLGVTGGYKLKEKNLDPWSQLEAWWTGVQNFAFPITVSNGTAEFIAADKSAISSFQAVYPPAGS